MTTFQHDTTTAAKTEWQPGQEVSNLRWAIGYRTHRLGDYLLKLGDRLCGDEPTSIEDVFDAGREYERRVTARKAVKA